MNDTIKMFVGGEEVVSDKNFTINEEMLSASSTILNNCFPASWELTKDYVSNYYYPKDYSKFLLASGEYKYGDTEFSVLTATGKNLFNKLNVLNGVFYRIPDGSVLETSIWSQSDYIQIDNTKKYTISSTYTTANNSFELTQYDKNAVWLKSQQFQMTTGYIVFGTDIIFEEETQYIKIGFRNDRVDTNTVQLEEGTAKTTYQNFGTNILYGTNVKKEWNKFDIYGNTYQETRSGKNLFGGKTFTNSASGMTSTYNIEGSILLNGNYSGTGNYYTMTSGQASQNNMLINLSSGTYALSVDILEHPNIQVVNSSGGAIYTLSSGNSSGTFTLNAETSLFVRIAVASGSSFSNVTYKIQLEKSSSATTWEAFGVQPSPDYPSELVSVGYQNLLKNTITNSGDNNYWYSYSTFDEVSRTITRSTTATTETYIRHNLSGLKSGTTYTLTLYAKSNGFVKSMDLLCFNQSTQGIKAISGLPLTTEYKMYTFSFTTSSDIIYGSGSAIRIDNNGSTTSGVEATLTIKDVCLVESDKPCAYVDYGKYGILIRNRNANLIDIETYQPANNAIITSSNNTIKVETTTNQFGSARYYQKDLQLRPNTTYTFSAKIISTTNPSGARIWVSDLFKTGGAVYSEATTPGNYAKITFTTESILPIDATLGLYPYTTNIEAVYGEVQIIESSTITPYIQHKENNQLYVLNEPLRRIDNVADELYTLGNTLMVKRNVGSKIFNGTESWNYVATGNTYNRSYVAVDDINITSSDSVKSPILSNYFKPAYYNAPASEKVNTITTRYNIAQINIFQNVATNNTDWKTWLSTHNTEVNYILATPTTEPLGKIDLPSSYEEMNYVDLYTGLETGMGLKYYWRNFNVLFAGVVKNTGDISLNPRHPHYCSLQVLDYKTFLSESDTLDFVISEKTIKEAIEMVVNAVSGYGFVVGNINITQADEIIGAYSTLNKTAYDVLQYLANISGSRWRARYVDSSTMAIDFYDPDLLPQANDIDSTQQYWEDNKIVDLTFNYGTRDYRNKQIMLSDQVYGSIDYTETVVSDGYNTSFIIQNEVASITNILANGEEKTSTTTNDKQMGADADFYYTPGKNTIESNIIYPAGTQITVIYTPLIKGRQIVFNDDEVSRISQQTDTVGVIARYENRNDILSSNDLQKIGQTYIKYKGKAEVILTLTTEGVDLFNIGEITHYNSPIADLSQDYMIKSKETQCILVNNRFTIFYVYELTSSFNSEKTINYFDNQRNKTTGNIQEGESIVRNIDIEHEALIIWDSATVTEESITIDGDNALNSTLNAPFIE